MDVLVEAEGSTSDYCYQVLPPGVIFLIYMQI